VQEVIYGQKRKTMAEISTQYQSKAKLLLQVAAISTAALALFGVYTFYRNEIWKPTIVVKDVDFANGVANLLINGRDFVLRGDSEYLISYDWGIKFGSTTTDSKRGYDRIEITKKGKVQKVLR